MEKQEIKFTLKDIQEQYVDPSPEFPKYVSPLVNLANRFSQATRPKKVGQVSELVRKCPAQDYQGWHEWYVKQSPAAIEEATDSVVSMLGKMHDALNNIDRDTVYRWVTDLVLKKTYVGLQAERTILKRAAEVLGTTYRPSSPEDESRGVDGHLGDQPVSVKPESYKKEKDRINEAIDVKMIYYEKKANGKVVADISEVAGS